MYIKFVPRVAPNTEPMTAVAMQYWLDAGTELLAAIAQTGSAMDRPIEKIIRVTLRPTRLFLICTGCTIFSVDGLLEATTWFEQALIRGSESHGVIRSEQRPVIAMRLSISWESITSNLRSRSSCLYKVL